MNWWVTFSSSLLGQRNTPHLQSQRNSCGRGCATHKVMRVLSLSRSIQRQFSENICSEDDLRCRIFGTFFVKFLACLPLLGFWNVWKMVQLPIFNGFLPYKGHLEFSGVFFLAKTFEKVSFDPYNIRITRISARKSEQMKNLGGIKTCLCLPFKNWNTFNNAV